MKIYHLALGGCLTAPNTRYGLTEDTGGHIAYVLGAASAQSERADVSEVTIVTRAFDDPALGRDHAATCQTLNARLAIRRLRTANCRYLSKDALTAELPALRDAFLEMLQDPARRPDVIHAHFADAAFLAQAAKDVYGIPFIYTPHSLGIDKMAHLEVPLGPCVSARIAQEKAALCGADAIVVSSRDEAERQLAAYGLDVEGKVHRIWPGVDLPDPGAANSQRGRDLLSHDLHDPGRPIILAIARPVLRKNLALLARTYAHSPVLQAQANLVILAGQHGPDVVENEETAAVWTELRQTLNRAGLEGLICLPKSHRPEDVGSIYAMARQTRGVFVNVALHEPFGLTILEAASHGLPVIAGDRGGPPDIIAQTGHGRVIDPTDPNALEAALLGLLTDSDAWEQHARSARKNLAPFNWVRWADDVARVYGDAVAPPKRGPAWPTYVLGCDIDGTLTGSRTAALALARWLKGRRGLFAVATGRSIAQARWVLGEWDLPTPDVFITAVGTEIHMRDGAGRWVRDGDYTSGLEMDWQPDAVRECIDATGIRWQAEIEQRQWKFGCLGDVADANRLRENLISAGLCAKVIPSHSGLIDVIPLRGGKGKALSFVAQKFGLSSKDVIAAGDSGNDIDMLLACGRGVVVGNALPEIAHLANHPHLYHAGAHFAAGVLEGIAYFDGFEDRDMRHGPVPAIRKNQLARRVS